MCVYAYYMRTYHSIYFTMLYTNTRRLLWTLVSVAIVSDDIKTPERIEFIFDYFWSIECEFSRFRIDSSLSILNREKFLRVSSRFISIMKLCQQKYDQTDGLFNPLVQVARLGYSYSFDESRFEPTKNAVDVDFSKVLVGSGIISLQPNQNLDFGGIAKWYAVDMASAMLLAFGYDNFFVNAGWDIYAHGCNESWLPWSIGIENPFTLVADISLALKNTAIATSGRYKRNWQIDNQEYHHLVHPKTGTNNSPIMSVTLIGKKCVDCDSFTKSIFHLTPEEGIRKIHDYKLEGMIYDLHGNLFCSHGLIDTYGLIFAGQQQ